MRSVACYYMMLESGVSGMPDACAGRAGRAHIDAYQRELNESLGLTVP